MEKRFTVSILSLSLLFVCTLFYYSFAQLENRCQCVAFRLDDVEDHYLDKENKQIIKVFQEKNASLTLGIVGNLFGHDENLISFIRNRMHDSNSQLTISNHGWNHEDFRKFSKDNQSLLIKRTNEKLNDTLGVRPSVFIAPFDVFNKDTLVALKENGIRYLSSIIDNDPGWYVTHGDTMPYHIPSTATTSDDNGTYWVGLKHENTSVQIQNSVSKYGFAVVEMHPYEYSTKHSYSYKPFNITNTNQTFSYKEFIKNWNEAGIDWKQIRELQLLIDEVREKGYRIVPIEKLAY
jgi:peptidoglycan/xylan/chitin deacetylase (PgdA/CDA1 family)